MRFKFFISICALLALGVIANAQSKSITDADLQMLKDYFNSADAEQMDDHKEKLKDFVVRPYNPKFSEYTDYKLEFTVSNKVYPKILKGYLVFYFPHGFDLSALDLASIQTNTYSEGFITNVTVEGQFAFLNYSIAYVDSANRPLPEKIKFDVTLRAIKNHSRAGKYKIAGAGIKDHKFVAGPSWSEKFEITDTPNFSLFGISSTEVIAPNSPRVNTGQSFQVVTSIHNRISNPQYGVRVNLRSDGISSFQAVKDINVINPMDSVVVHFDITAGNQANESENFEVSIDVPQPGGDVEIIDNEATAIIQTPATLEVTSSVEDNSVIHMGSDETLDVSFNLLNHGQAGVSIGHYTITETGTEINPDTVIYSGSMQVGAPVEYHYNSTNSGRTVLVNFSLETIPTDSNTRQSAQIMDSEIDFTIIENAVKPGEPDDSIAVEDNPFDPDDGPVEIQYTLPGDMNIDFNIYTIVGEEVYSRFFRYGTNGGQAGVNSVQWDGRNDAGHVVLNGVYVIVITNDVYDIKKTIKLAVLK